MRSVGVSLHGTGGESLFKLKSLGEKPWAGLSSINSGHRVPVFMWQIHLEAAGSLQDWDDKHHPSLGRAEAGIN